jgi:hypothetical protein
MASKRTLQRAVKRLAMGEPEIKDLAEKLLTTKRRVYRRTLASLAQRLGYSDTGLPNLSDEVLAALEAESRDHAERMAATFNADLVQQAAKLGPLPNEKVGPTLTSWANSRQRKRAKPIAITEAYTAHADATMSAILDFGLPEGTLFDFGGHPELGDAHPVCSICKELVTHNPWTVAEVVQIGNPHPGCRQLWRLSRLEQRDLPAELPDLGQTIAGIVGKDSLITRAGDRDAATAFVAQLSE